MGLNFSFYEYMKKISDKLLSSTETTQSSVLGNIGVLLKNGLCGAVAGGASKFMVYPLDTMKRRMQMQVLSNTLSGAVLMPQYKNAWHCFMSTLKNEGMGGFYKVHDEYINSLTDSFAFNAGYCSHSGQVCPRFGHHLCGV